MQRIFGQKDKNKIYTMQPKTKHTLALFLMYENWECLELALFRLVSDKIILNDEIRKKISQILIEII